MCVCYWNIGRWVCEQWSVCVFLCTCISVCASMCVCGPISPPTPSRGIARRGEGVCRNVLQCTGAHVAWERLLTWESDPKDYASDRPSLRSQDLNSFLTFSLPSSNLSLLVRICLALILLFLFLAASRRFQRLTCHWRTDSLELLKYSTQKQCQTLDKYDQN